MRLLIKNIVTIGKSLEKKMKREGYWLSYSIWKKSTMLSSKNISENFSVNSLLSFMGLSLPLLLLRKVNRRFV
jgi:hypothetical protein